MSLSHLLLGPFRRLDPFWLVSLFFYTGHRLWQYISPASGWMSSYWNDIWMLPCALPPVLCLYERLGLRRVDLQLSLPEILWHGLLWGMMAEWLGPMFFQHVTGDPWDLLAYGVGGGMLYLRWNLLEPLVNGFATRL
ncbi:hypothetical protein OAK97_01240 [bacterium]|nr:hypothetical protein [bacterium]MDG1890685.1 hypothetical protein [Verrucomicrobiota bacterium]